MRGAFGEPRKTDFILSATHLQGYSEPFRELCDDFAVDPSESDELQLPIVHIKEDPRVLHFLLSFIFSPHAAIKVLDELSSPWFLRNTWLMAKKYDVILVTHIVERKMM